jgi:nitrate reductase gamma subunit
MSLLEFARGPGMVAALSVFVAGCLWRLGGLALLRGGKDLSEPRNRAAWKGLRLIALRSWPRREFLEGTAFGEITGYTFHIGFLLTLFCYAPHLAFFGDLLRGRLGVPLPLPASFAGPSLPAGVASVLAVISLVALLAVLVHRLVNPVKRLISNFDDYCSWLMTVAPLATGLVAHASVGGPRYETFVAAHLLATEALLLWFPFGKLMHAFTIFAARGLTGMLFERKGAAL